mmetsp:Transcript_17846/g.25137  ORF Transcript_17846/g.25137 Transcript_17846/m.25137 type:complete len:127 (+) Transcript_17846:1651-2031(+)
MLDFLTQEGFGGDLHLLKDHGRNFFGGKLEGLSILVNFDHGLVLIRNDLVGDQFLVGLNRLVREVASNKTLNIKDSVFRVDGGLILGGITDKTVTIFHKGNVRRGNTVTLVIGDDFDTSVLENTNT